MVLTVREGGTTTFDPRPSDKVILFRTYNHLPRNASGTKNKLVEFNPKALDKSKLQIHEACSATSAAPTYFRPITLYGRKYIDGAVKANNPSTYAWNEAVQMEHFPGESQAPAAPSNKTPYAVVSLGNGMTKTHSQFGLISMISDAVKRITDPEPAHRETESRAADHSCPYFRFNVPYDPLALGHDGLAKVDLCACEKIRRKPSRNEKTLINRSMPQPNANAKLTDRRAKEDEALYKEAEEPQKGGFKPSKYYYRTFDVIRERTLGYCDGILGEINDCADILRKHMVERMNDNGVSGPSFADFRKHPNPHWTNPKFKKNGSSTDSS